MNFDASVIKKTKIIALPYAGGSKYCYRDFEASIPNDFEWVTFELPGRGNRINEDFLINIEDIVNDLFSKILPFIKSSEYIIYGHSLGTLLGYELVKKIIASNLSMPLFLFFTGRGAPNVVEKEKLADLDKESFWKKIKEIGGLPSGIIEDNELKSFFGPIIRSDFRIVENYKFIDLDAPLSIPIYIGIGNKELLGEETEKVKWNHILEWQNITKHPIDVKFYDGNHFFILNHTQALVKEIVKTVALCRKEKFALNV